MTFGRWQERRYSIRLIDTPKARDLAFYLSELNLRFHCIVYRVFGYHCTSIHHIIISLERKVVRVTGREASSTQRPPGARHAHGYPQRRPQR